MGMPDASAPSDRWDADPDEADDGAVVAWAPEQVEDTPWRDGPDDAMNRADSTLAADQYVAADPDTLESVSPDDPAWAAAPVDLDDPMDEPAQATDWLDRICPYLVSDDGTSRSSQPDERHRCTAQDPPATLPLAFQERFCLTERHVRCEMYKVAEDARSAAFAEDSIPAEQVKSARFRPTVRSRPVALEPSTSAPADPPPPPGPNRQILIALGGAGAFALVLLVVAVLLGGGGGGSALPDGGIVTPPPDAGPAATTAPRGTLAPQETPGAAAIGTEGPVDAGSAVLIRYEVQGSERLQKIATTFGTTLRAIVQANPDFGDEGNARDARAGDILIVPVASTMAEQEIMAVKGFVEFVEP